MLPGKEQLTFQTTMNDLGVLEAEKLQKRRWLKCYGTPCIILLPKSLKRSLNILNLLTEDLPLLLLVTTVVIHNQCFGDFFS